MVHFDKGQSQKLQADGRCELEDFSSFANNRQEYDFPAPPYIASSVSFSGSTSSIAIPHTGQRLPKANATVDRYDLEHQPFAVAYLDKNGEFCVNGSETIRHRLHELFDQRFEKRFQDIIESTESGRNEPFVIPRRVKVSRRAHNVPPPINGTRRPYSARTASGNSHDRKRRAIASLQSRSRCGSESQPDDFVEEDQAVPKPQRSQKIKVGDATACIDFYRQRFHLIQQVPCKLIAKDWIKAIEPKKQTQYPYNGGKAAKEARDEWEAKGKIGGAWDFESDGNYSKPPWWPEDVKHKEPDHIKKKERVNLLIHLLRNLHDHQPYNVRVAVLKASTKRTVAGFPDIKGGPGAELLERWLNEIYELREKEEQYIEGGIDAGTCMSFPEPITEPRRNPKRIHRQPHYLHRDRRSLTEASDNEQSEDNFHENDPETESATSLASPVGKLGIGSGLAPTPRNSFARQNGSIDNPSHYENSYSWKRNAGSMPELDMEDLPIKTPQSVPVTYSNPQSILGSMNDHWMDDSKSYGQVEPLNTRQLAVQKRSPSQSQPSHPLHTALTPETTVLGHAPIHAFRNNSVPNIQNQQDPPDAWTPFSTYQIQNHAMSYAVEDSSSSDVPANSVLIHGMRQRPSFHSMPTSGVSAPEYTLGISSTIESQSSLNEIPQINGFVNGLPTT